jgi:FtsP/CotA-like multicopper oxidase with cupredoxin domain
MKAPVVTQSTCFSHVQAVVGNIAPEVRGRIEARNRAARQAALQAAAEPTPLLTVCVEPRPGTPPMEFPDPAKWPDMPPFLQNIPPPAITDKVAFSMHGTSTNDPKNNFFINDVQYCPECANHTLTLKIAEEWTLTNDSAPQHPFHIHTNPHQLVEQGSLIKGQPIAFQKYDPPLWEDTIALPNQGMCWNIQAGPIFNNDDAQQKCPQACTKTNADLQWKGNWVTTNPGTMSVCNCCTPSDSTGYVKIRQLPTDFTGEFVLHCHILGHEDRGMMQNVQVVCPAPNQTSFGKPRPEQPECVEGNYIPAAKKCPPHYATGDKCAL